MHVAFLKQSHRCFSRYYMFLYCPILKELYKWKIHKIARHDDVVVLKFRVATQVKILAISTVSHFIDWDGSYGIYVRIVWKENTEEFNATRQHIYVRLISSCVNANNRYVIMQSSHSLSLFLSTIPYILIRLFKSSVTSLSGHTRTHFIIHTRFDANNIRKIATAEKISFYWGFTLNHYSQYAYKPYYRKFSVMVMHWN